MHTTIPTAATPRPSRAPVFGLAALQACGYWALWALLHVAKAVPTSDNGFWTPKSSYAVRVGRLPIVALLGAKQHPYLAGLLFLGIVVLLCLCYGATIISLWRRPITLSTSTLLILTVVMALPLLVLPRILSSDVYAYGLYGRIAALYHANPFVTRPDQFPHDPLFPYIAWTTTPSVYGPTMIALSFPLTWLAQALGGSAGVYVLIYKLAGLAALLGSMVVLKRLLEQRWPARAVAGTLVFAWHPLVLIELVGSGHNDSLMILLVLLALWCAVQDRRLLTVLLLALAAMLKLVALLFIPLYVLYTLRTRSAGRWTLAVKQCALALVVVALLYAPFWVGPRTLNVLVSAPPLRIMRGGPAMVVEQAIADRRCQTTAAPGKPAPPANTKAVAACQGDLTNQVRTFSLALFFLVYAALALWPIGSFDSLIDRSAWALVAYTLLAAISFRPWYVTWVVALVPLMRRPRALLLVWGCAVLLDYSRLPIWQRNALEFIPIVILLVLEAWSLAQSVRRPNPQEILIAS